ncbi:MAG: YitT family protein [Paludibacteraceae bacterium]|nr:YitT family protein [Paludibacteraceae bacterium]
MSNFKTHVQSLLSDFGQALHTRKFWVELVMMTVGMTFGAAAVYYFLMPSHMIVGSISGLSIVINTVIGGNADTLSYIIMGLNAVLLVMAFILIGNEFGAKTVYTAMILGPLTQLLDRIYPYTNFTHHLMDTSAANYQSVLHTLQSGAAYKDAFGNDYLLSRAGEVLEPVRSSVMAGGLQTGDVWFDLVCFVVLLSACQAFMFRINASTGGLDIMAKIINKYAHYDIGMSVSIAGAVICCTAFLINDFRMVVIGLTGTWINGLVVDYFTASFNKRKRVCIISNEPDRIRLFIVEKLIRGCSLYPVKGGYSGEDHTEIQVLLTQNEFSDLMAFIRDNQIRAFITAGNCSEVYGLWLRHKKVNGKIIAVNE